MKFSIIIPVYNCENKLHISLDSLLQQTYANFEIILVDDGSKDHSLSVCRQYEKEDSRIRVFHISNSGPAAARNYGLKKCVGDYVFFFDADDYIDKDALCITESLLVNEKWDVIIFGYSGAKYVNGEISDLYVHALPKKEYRSNLAFKNDYLQLDSEALTYPVWNKSYRLAFIEECGAIFPEGVSVAEDFCFNAQLYTRANKVLVIDWKIYKYIYHPRSITSTFSIGKMEAIEYVYRYGIRTIGQWNKETINKARNSYIRDISVFVNNMFNPDTRMPYKKKRKLVQKIVLKESVQECIHQIECTSFRNKIIVMLLRFKMVDLLLLSGKVARIVGGIAI